MAVAAECRLRGARLRRDEPASGFAWRRGPLALNLALAGVVTAVTLAALVPAASATACDDLAEGALLTGDEGDAPGFVAMTVIGQIFFLPAIGLGVAIMAASSGYRGLSDVDTVPKMVDCCCCCVGLPLVIIGGVSSSSWVPWIIFSCLLVTEAFVMYLNAQAVPYDSRKMFRILTSSLCCAGIGLLVWTSVELATEADEGVAAVAACNTLDHGVCIGDDCVCDTGYFGDGCQVCPPGQFCPDDGAENVASLCTGGPRACAAGSTSDACAPCAVRMYPNASCVGEAPAPLVCLPCDEACGSACAGPTAADCIADVTPANADVVVAGSRDCAASFFDDGEQCTGCSSCPAGTTKSADCTPTADTVCGFDVAGDPGPCVVASTEVELGDAGWISMAAFGTIAGLPSLVLAFIAWHEDETKIFTMACGCFMVVAVPLAVIGSMNMHAMVAGVVFSATGSAVACCSCGFFLVIEKANRDRSARTPRRISTVILAAAVAVMIWTSVEVDSLASESSDGGIDVVVCDTEHGTCSADGTCLCDAGFIGPQCDELCDPGMWCIANNPNLGFPCENGVRACPAGSSNGTCTGCAAGAFPDEPCTAATAARDDPRSCTACDSACSSCFGPSSADCAVLTSELGDSVRDCASGFWDNAGVCSACTSCDADEIQLRSCTAAADAQCVAAGGTPGLCSVFAVAQRTVETFPTWFVLFGTTGVVVCMLGIPINYEDLSASNETKRRKARRNVGILAVLGVAGLPLLIVGALVAGGWLPWLLFAGACVVVAAFYGAWAMSGPSESRGIATLSCVCITGGVVTVLILGSMAVAEDEDLPGPGWYILAFCGGMAAWCTQFAFTGAFAQIRDGASESGPFFAFGVVGLAASAVMVTFAALELESRVAVAAVLWAMIVMAIVFLIMLDKGTPGHTLSIVIVVVAAGGILWVLVAELVDIRDEVGFTFCEAPTATCSDDGTCLCDAGYMGLECDEQCPPGFACANLNPSEPTQCAGGVLACAWGSSDAGCTACSVGSFPAEPCTSGNLTPRCEACDAACAMCFNGTAADCTAIDGGYAAGSQHRACADGYFNGPRGVCTQCTECATGTYAVAECTGLTDTVCSPCDHACEACHDASTNCTATADDANVLRCAQGFTTSGLSGSKACVACTPCADDEYSIALCTPAQEATCAACHADCNGECFGPTAGDCGVGGGDGVTCRAGYTANADLTACEPCSPRCVGGLTYETTPCTHSTDRECSACSTRCGTFEHISEQCTELQDLQCTPCPEGWAYIEGTGACHECPLPFTCVGGGNCTEGADPDSLLCGSCREGYYPLLQTCRVCPELTWGAMVPGLLAMGLVSFLAGKGALTPDNLRKLRQLAAHVQTTNIFFSLNIEWPDWARNIWRDLQGLFGDFALYSPQCSITDNGWYLKAALTLITAMGAVLLLYLIRALLAAYAHRVTRKQLLKIVARRRDRDAIAASLREAPEAAASAHVGRRRCCGLRDPKPAPAVLDAEEPHLDHWVYDATALVGKLPYVLLLLMQVPLLRTALEGLDCKDTAEGWVLIQDVSISCTSRTHAMVSLVCFIFAVGIGVVFPMTFIGVIVAATTQRNAKAAQSHVAKNSASIVPIDADASDDPDPRDKSAGAALSGGSSRDDSEQQAISPRAVEALSRYDAAYVAHWFEPVPEAVLTRKVHDIRRLCSDPDCGDELMKLLTIVPKTAEERWLSRFRNLTEPYRSATLYFEGVLMLTRSLAVWVEVAFASGAVQGIVAMCSQVVLAWIIWKTEPWKRESVDLRFWRWARKGDDDDENVEQANNSWFYMQDALNTMGFISAASGAVSLGLGLIALDIGTAGSALAALATAVSGGTAVLLLIVLLQPTLKRYVFCCCRSDVSSQIIDDRQDADARDHDAGAASGDATGVSAGDGAAQDSGAGAPGVKEHSIVVVAPSAANQLRRRNRRNTLNEHFVRVMQQRGEEENYGRSICDWQIRRSHGLKSSGSSRHLFDLDANARVGDYDAAASTYEVRRTAMEGYVSEMRFRRSTLARLTEAPNTGLPAPAENSVYMFMTCCARGRGSVGGELRQEAAREFARTMQAIYGIERHLQPPDVEQLIAWIQHAPQDDPLAQLAMSRQSAAAAALEKQDDQGEQAVASGAASVVAGATREADGAAHKGGKDGSDAGAESGFDSAAANAASTPSRARAADGVVAATPGGRGRDADESLDNRLDVAMRALEASVKALFDAAKEVPLYGEKRPAPRQKSRDEASAMAALLADESSDSEDEAELNVTDDDVRLWTHDDVAEWVAKVVEVPNTAVKKHKITGADLLGTGRNNLTLYFLQFVMKYQPHQACRLATHVHFKWWSSEQKNRLGYHNVRLMISRVERRANRLWARGFDAKHTRAFLGRVLKPESADAVAATGITPRQLLSDESGTAEFWRNLGAGLCEAECHYLATVCVECRWLDETPLHPKQTLRVDVDDEAKQVRKLVQAWTNEEVCEWAVNVLGISHLVAGAFYENFTVGRELLSIPAPGRMAYGSRPLRVLQDRAVGDTCEVHAVRIAPSKDLWTKAAVEAFRKKELELARKYRTENDADIKKDADEAAKLGLSFWDMDADLLPTDINTAEAKTDTESKADGGDGGTGGASSSDGAGGRPDAAGAAARAGGGDNGMELGDDDGDGDSSDAADSDADHDTAGVPSEAFGSLDPARLEAEKLKRRDEKAAKALQKEMAAIKDRYTKARKRVLTAMTVVEEALEAYAVRAELVHDLLVDRAGHTGGADLQAVTGTKVASDGAVAAADDASPIISFFPSFYGEFFREAREVKEEVWEPVMLLRGRIDMVDAAATVPNWVQRWLGDGDGLKGYKDAWASFTEAIKALDFRTLASGTGPHARLERLHDDGVQRIIKAIYKALGEPRDRMSVVKRRLNTAKSRAGRVGATAGKQAGKMGSKLVAAREFLKSERVRTALKVAGCARRGGGGGSRLDRWVARRLQIADAVVLMDVLRGVLDEVPHFFKTRRRTGGYNHRKVRPIKYFMAGNSREANVEQRTLNLDNYTGQYTGLRNDVDDVSWAMMGVVPKQEALRQHIARSAVYEFHRTHYLNLQRKCLAIYGEAARLLQLRSKCEVGTALMVVAAAQDIARTGEAVCQFMKSTAIDRLSLEEGEPGTHGPWEFKEDEWLSHAVDLKHWRCKCRLCAVEHQADEEAREAAAKEEEIKSKLSAADREKAEEEARAKRLKHREHRIAAATKAIEMATKRRAEAKQNAKEQGTEADKEQDHSDDKKGSDPKSDDSNSAGAGAGSAEKDRDGSVAGAGAGGDAAASHGEASTADEGKAPDASTAGGDRDKASSPAEDENLNASDTIAQLVSTAETDVMAAAPAAGGGATDVASKAASSDGDEVTEEAKGTEA